MNGLERIYLGWQQPLLHAAVKQIVATYRPTAASWNLSRLTAVLPVSRAGHRLRELLEAEAAELGVALRPPKMITVGALPELLYASEKTLANEMQQTLAWTQVLSHCDDAHLAPLMPITPARDAVAAWFDMASLIRRLCQDLAADAWQPADVVSHVQSAADKQRWRLIAKLYEDYLAVLEQADLADPHQQRRLAVARSQCRLGNDVVLIGCVDLGEQTCGMLSSVAQRVVAYVGAPASEARLFDRFGRVEPTGWAEFAIEIDDSRLISCGDAEHQASVAVAQLRSWQQNNPGAPVSLGIADDSFAAILETELLLAGEHPERVAGKLLRDSAAGRLLGLLRDFLSGHSWQAFAALIRHADVMAQFGSQVGSFKLLRELDSLRAEYFPLRISEPWSKPADFANLRGVLDQILSWLEPLSDQRLMFSEWAQRLRDVLDALYSEQADASEHNDPNRQLILEQIDRLLHRFAELPSALDVELGSAGAIDLVLQRLGEPHVREAAEPSVRQETRVTEIVGWLDLTLDDAPALAVVGLNHPFVPQAVTADPFLPGSLRTQLNIADNERRFARDAYILQSICQTRSEFAILVGRYGPDGSPTPPSRLLAACEPATTVRRVRALLTNPPVSLPRTSLWDSQAEVTRLPLPVASPTSTMQAVSVTAFRDYLTCPFRFYLRHVLGLRPLADGATELAANQFGDLVHAAVEFYGQCSDKDLQEAADIEASVLEHLHTYAKSRYGASPLAAVRLQIAQAEKRLKQFAITQSARRQAGWQIHVAEAAVRANDGAEIKLPSGAALKLKGRVDRIDYHPGDNVWAILDYKTHGHHPMAKHYDEKNEQWLDLQLPLYLFMLKALGIEASEEAVQLGYFNIAEKERETGVNIAEFTSGQIAAAKVKAEQVAEGILAGNFEPQLDPLKVPFDDFSMIMQTGTAESLLIDLLETE